MKKFKILIILLSYGMIILNCGKTSKENAIIQNSSRTNTKLIVNTYDSGFREKNPRDHKTYNGISCASDGKIYYVLKSASIDEGAQMYSFDPKADKITHLCDITEVCGEKRETGIKPVPQGKVHVHFYEAEGKLYFATHRAYYEVIDGVELIPRSLPEGYESYLGGHLVSYDLESGEFEDFGIPIPYEGILTMSMDTERKVMYGLSWPSGILFRYEVNNGKNTVIGPITGEGEKGEGSDFRVICRSIAIDPRDGSAYMTRSEGNIFRLRLGQDKIELVEGESMIKDYFGNYNVSDVGPGAYNWRQTVWSPRDKKIYGVHGNSGYLFRFNPDIPRIEVLDRITSLPSKRSGMFDQFHYGYLGFSLGPDLRKIYYLTGAPLYDDKGKRITSTERSLETLKYYTQENTHLITYDISNYEYQDHGPVFYQDGDKQRRPLDLQSIAVGKDNTVYTLGEITTGGNTRCDLISIGIGQ